jgi:hypothetical protein
MGTLSLMMLYVDKGLLENGLHSRGGVVFFDLALVMLLPVFLGLRKLGSRHVSGRMSTG